MSKLTIVMYHYVRELTHSRYPEIKGLEIESFKDQISYIKEYYNPISAYDLMDAVEFGAALPPQPILLTFDDAYIDHFAVVFPILNRENISGCFFPSAKCILESCVLDVNKIHFILACVQDKSLLVNYLYESIAENKSLYDLESKEYYWRKYGVQSRYDSAEVMFTKRMLQRAMPEELRRAITADLFKKFVSADEKAFSKELYMNIDQVTCLQRNGMYIGSHGFDHYWLNSVSEFDQQKEVDLSLQFLKVVGSDPNRWIICYPYGAYNQSLLTILKNRNCSIGLTTEVRVADLKNDNKLALPRLDTNDLSKGAFREFDL